MIARANPTTVSRVRRGLAPLELVLSLPLLLFVLALMINFATVVRWKVRALTNSRHAVWRARWPRSGQWDGHPATWPATASMGIARGQRLPQLDDPAVRHAVARGPLPNGFGVDADLLDPSRGMALGTADIKRTMPLLPKMRQYEFHLKHPLLNGAWQYPTPEMKQIPWTAWRRIPYLYTLPQTNASLPANFVDAVNQIIFASFRPDLFPLDRDEELKEFTGRYWEFHPDLAWHCCHGPIAYPFCHLDRSAARQNEVEQLINHIKGKCEGAGDQVRVVDGGVPWTMTAWFLWMYESKLAQLRAQMQTPRPDPRIIGQIAQLQAKIDELKKFLKVVEQNLRRECEARRNS